MARIHHVAKARASKKDRHCRTCGKPIEAGQAYKHLTLYRSATKMFHEDCRIRPSEQTNAKYGVILDVIEDASGDIADWKLSEGTEALTSILETVASEVEQVASEYQDAAMELGGAGERMEEAASQLEDFAGELTGLETYREDDEEDDDYEERLSDEAQELLNNFEEPDLC